MKFTMSNLLRVALPFLLIMVLGCRDSKTEQLWTQVYPDYVALSTYEIPDRYQDLKTKGNVKGDNWYWSDDGK